MMFAFLPYTADSLSAIHKCSWLVFLNNYFIVMFLIHIKWYAWFFSTRYYIAVNIEVKFSLSYTCKSRRCNIINSHISSFEFKTVFIKFIIFHVWYSYIAPVEFFIKIFKCFVIRKFLRGKLDIVRKFNFDRCRTVYTNLKPAVISPLYGNKADLPAEMVVCLPHMYLPESKMCKPPVSVVVLKYITVTCCLYLITA